MLQQPYALTIEEKLEIERLQTNQPLMQALMKMSLIREQEAMENMAEALEGQDRDEALRWAGYRKAVEDFFPAMRTISLSLESLRKENATGTEPEA
jgi:hypothetical protein